LGRPPKREADRVDRCGACIVDYGDRCSRRRRSPAAAEVSGEAAGFGGFEGDPEARAAAALVALCSANESAGRCQASGRPPRRAHRR
jgi:hypothetical protein